MAEMANITVKAADGTTDVLYTAMNSAAGDGVKAMWRALAVGYIPAVQPYLMVWSRANANGTARRVDLEYRYQQQYTTTTTGLIAMANQTVVTQSYLVPNGMPTNVLSESAAQYANLLKSPLIQDCLKYGFGPQ